MQLNKIHSTRLLFAVMTCFVFLATAGLQNARAGDEKKNFVVGKWAYQKLNKAHQFISKGKYSKALAEMESMKRKKKLNEHERALMWQTIGFIYSSQEKFSTAIKSFEKCLSMNALPTGSMLDTQYNLGQLYMANRQYNKAGQVLLDWIGKVKKPAPDAKYILALSLTQTKQWRKALRWAKDAVASVKKPQEGWLQLLMSIHLELKQLEQVAKVLQRVITLYPKKNYWMQLSAVYGELKQTSKSLAVLELAYKQGMLTKGSDLKNLASLYMHEGVPYKAAHVLSKGMASGAIKKTERTLTVLGEAWLRAREFDRAIGPLEKAAKLSGNGNLFIRVAHIQMEKERWKKAIGSLRSALAKGKLRDAGNAYLLLGIANMRQGKYSAAKKAFNKAMSFTNTRHSAEGWMKSLADKVKPK